MLHLDPPIFFVIKLLLTHLLPLLLISLFVNLLLELLGIFLLFALFPIAHLVLSSDLHDVRLVVNGGILVCDELSLGLLMSVLLLQVHVVL